MLFSYAHITYDIHVLHVYYLPTATFDVQGESITCDHGVVKVTCIFARGSMAQGCLIVIVRVGSQSSTVHSERALRQESNGVLSQNTSHSFNLSVGTYNIVIFDVEADGHVDLMRWLYNEIINVNAHVSHHQQQHHCQHHRC